MYEKPSLPKETIYSGFLILLQLQYCKFTNLVVFRLPLKPTQPKLVHCLKPKTKLNSEV